MQADLLTIASLGCHPLSVLTALTVQDTRGVEALHGDRTRVGRRARRAACSPTCRSPRSSSACSARRATPRRSPRSSPSIRARPVVLDPVLASGRGDPLADAETIAGAARRAPAADDRADAEQHGGAPPRAGRARRGPRRLRARARGPGLQVRADHRHARSRRGGRQHALRRARRGARGPLAAAARRATTARAARSPRRSPPASPGGWPCEKRSRDAQDYTWQTLAAGFQPGRGQHLPNRFFEPMKLRGLYAITPELADARRRCCEQVAQALEGGIALLQYRRKGRAGRRDEASDARAPVPRAAACRSSSTTTSRSRSPAAPTACTSAATTATSPRRARSLAASCSAPPATTRSTRRAPRSRRARTTSPSAACSPRRPSPPRCARRSSLFAEARALGVPLVAIGGITLENAPQLLRAGADALAVISDLFDAPDIAGARARYGKLFRP